MMRLIQVYLAMMMVMMTVMIMEMMIVMMMIMMIQDGGGDGKCRERLSAAAGFARHNVEVFENVNTGEEMVWQDWAPQKPTDRLTTTYFGHF